MVDHNLIKSLNISDKELEKQLAQTLGEGFGEDSMKALVQDTGEHAPGQVLQGHIVNVIGNDVVVEVGLKSEGSVSVQEFDGDDSLDPGTPVEVFLEEVESDSGLVVLSKRKADRIRGWERISRTANEGDVVTGKVMRKIKGGLLVDIGVPAFLPASQVDVRRPRDIGSYIGQQLEAKILKIDQERRNIVISRRRLIEEERSEAKEKLLSEIEEGEMRKGQVKNIADFGAFVDLGGIDGLLHITDMSWGRINHPSELVKLDQELEVMVLRVDREKEKIALGLKQKTPSPWETVEEKYPIGTKIEGEVVNIMPYGAFVKLEEGLEGLVHISEMSWTRRISHPSEMVAISETVEIVVLEINKDKQEISLGMKQAETNPWTLVKQKYPPGTVITGTVRNMTNYGAFIEIEEGIDGLLHISDLSWTRKVGHPAEMLEKGQELQCVVLAVDEEKMRVALGLKQLSEDPWLRQIPEHYMPGQIVKGKVTKITNFGVFVELEDSLEGLLHVSELADHKVENPQDVVKAGEELEVKILRVDTEDRKIGLSLKRVQWAAEEGEAEPVEESVKRRGGLAGEGGLLGEMTDHFMPTSEGQPAKQADEAAEAPPAEGEPGKAPEPDEPRPSGSGQADAEKPAVEAGKPEDETKQSAGETEAPEQKAKGAEDKDEDKTEDEQESQAT